MHHYKSVPLSLEEIVFPNDTFQPTNYNWNNQLIDLTSGGMAPYILSKSSFGNLNNSPTLAKPVFVEPKTQFNFGAFIQKNKGFILICGVLVAAAILAYNYQKKKEEETIK
jgi:large-conductance mechanosensitive channel